MRLKDYYGPPETEKALIDAIMRGERPMGLGPEFIIDDDEEPRKKALSGMAPMGYSLKPKSYMSYG